MCVCVVGGDVCLLQGRWICEMPSSEVKARVNLNEHITDKLEARMSCIVWSKDSLPPHLSPPHTCSRPLTHHTPHSSHTSPSHPSLITPHPPPHSCTQELVSVYQNNGDKWRALQTNKAIQSIKKQTTEITSYEVRGQLEWGTDFSICVLFLYRKLETCHLWVSV